ncbi:MAG: glutamate synthase subunit beta [Spirochaetia bacterium]|nr:glutamate synthase subunit beta [Spirochaetia bacterium]
MGKPTGFLEYKRVNIKKQGPKERVKHFREFDQHYDQEACEIQTARCMNCGIPFCHGETGCPLDNLIPEWNDLVYRKHWKSALENLHSTNNFPEFTGRVCPAPCESACTLGLIEKPVSVKSIERSIIANGFEHGWVKPKPPKEINNKTVAIIGSGPSGLACAQQLARVGYVVSVFEKNKNFGGLLRYGIPDFKLDKSLIEKRIEQMKAEGVKFKSEVNVGKDLSIKELLEKYDAIVLAIGSEKPRDLRIEGRDLNGIHFAMKYLKEQNMLIGGEQVEHPINAKGKHVIVLGGGDTGADCVGTANRQGAASVTQFEIMPKPPEERPPETPWPYWPNIYRTASSHEEGVERLFSVSTKEFIGDKNGNIKSLKYNQVEYKNGKFIETPKTTKEIKADLVLLAMGFLHPEPSGLIAEFQKKGLKLDSKGNIQASFDEDTLNHQTSIPNVFSCGDSRRGQSLVVWAIAEGRKCAMSIHQYFTLKNK